MRNEPSLIAAQPLRKPRAARREFFFRGVFRHDDRLAGRKMAGGKRDRDMKAVPALELPFPRQRVSHGDDGTFRGLREPQHTGMNLEARTARAVRRNDEIGTFILRGANGGQHGRSPMARTTSPHRLDAEGRGHVRNELPTAAAADERQRHAIPAVSPEEEGHQRRAIMPEGDDHGRAIRFVEDRAAIIERHAQAAADGANDEGAEPGEEASHPMPGPRSRPMSRERARLGVFTKSSLMKTSQVIEADSGNARKATNPAAIVKASVQ